MKTTKQIKFQLFIALLTVIFMSCEKQDVHQDKEIDMKGTYVVGITTNRERYITLWKDGVEQNITDGKYYAEPTSMFVNNGDVYITGYENIDGYLKSRVWKNGESVNLAPNGDQANSVFVSDGNVYVTGFKCTVYPERYDSTRVRYDVLVWKDGIIIDTLITNNTFADARKIFVKGNDIYVSTIESIGSRSVTKVWKNGTVLYNLTNGDKRNEPRDMFISDSNVYLAGYGYYNNGVSIFWENDILTELNIPSKYSEAFSLFVDNNDVYIAGVEEYKYPYSSAVYWKNGEKNILPLSSNTVNSYAFSIYVKQNNIYVAGVEAEEGKEGNATIWVNGKSKRLSDAYTSAAKFIYVAK